MKIAVIGLGRMGAAIVHRALTGDHEVVGYDPSAQARDDIKKMGAQAVEQLSDLTNKVRIFWIMVPAGKPVDDVITTLLPGLQKDDIVIDGGNSLFKDSIRRHDHLATKGIHFLDCGVSGGLKGREIGFSLMVGGNMAIFETMIPLFKALAAPQGYAYMGKAGTGHYVKMVHNGIEYALLQAYAEGFDLLRNGHYKDLDLADIAKVWGNGAVVRSWILELCADVFKHDQQLKEISGQIAEILTGRWTVDEAHEHKIPVKLIEESLNIRAWSRQTGGNYGTKVVAKLRNAFGGHEVKKEEK